ncbi:MAG: trehalose-phosphatase [Proteobacteria bacterium]|nr:trehalose-phosphatase [Pseudomonadota bacterium]
MATIAAHPDQWALFLDIDGTLLDIAEQPDAVRVPTDLVDSLARIRLGLSGAVAVLTGRPIEGADRLLAPLRLAASGVHGSEMRSTAGGAIEQCARPLDAAFLASVRSLAEHLPGVRVEPKTTGLAVHYRSAKALAPKLKQELGALIASMPAELDLRDGRFVIEITDARHSKATALDVIAAQPAFLGRRTVMIGDDSGDETALALSRQRGGYGFRVAGEHFGKTDAEFASPAHVRDWLSRLARCFGPNDRAPGLSGIEAGSGGIRRGASF